MFWIMHRMIKPAGVYAAGILKFIFKCSLVHCCFFYLSMGITGCAEAPQDSFQGYVEGDYVLVSSPIAGQLQTLAVRRGMVIAAGEPLFALEHAYEAAAVAEGEQVLRRAENRLSDLTKGRRPSELAAMQAKLEQAKATYNLAHEEFSRREKLFQQNVVSQQELLRYRTDMERNKELVAQLTAELKTAKLGARQDAIKAARADVEAARNRLEQARWRLGQKSQAVPVAGLVYDTFYVAGEYVPAAYPVVSILPPANIKIRFFVPEEIVGTLSMGQKVSISFDGAKSEYPAAIAYISANAEYTPPVIYSRETRAHLVFMIEARIAPEQAGALHPGQPVDVRLMGPHG
jgi:HlyD family secretion protein